MINNDRNRLFLYVIISLIFHLLVFYFFPFGFLEGFSKEEASGNNFGYVQYVDYKSQTNDTQKQEKQETEQKAQEEPQEETEPEPESEPEPEPEPEPEEKTNDQNIEIAQENEPEEQVEETETNQEQEVISSEESDTEIEVEQQEETQEEQSSEETEPEPEPEPEPSPPPTAGELIGLSPKPVYPKYLVSEAQSGEVGLNVKVASNGEVENIVITNSSNIESMDRNAKLTVENGWEFKSYEQRYQIDVTVDFNIDESGNPNVNVEIGSVNFL